MKRLVAVLFVLSLILAEAPCVSIAQVAPVPALMNFQGRIGKPDGTPVADGTYAVRFSLHDAATGGNEKWSQTVSTVAVRSGTFAVLLSGFPTGTFSGNLWLEIKVGNDAPLAPRQPLASVAYAMKAGSVQDGAISNASLANGTLTADKFAPNAFNPLTWLLGGNSGVTGGFLGTTDTNPLEFRVNNHRAMRYNYAETNDNSSVNVLGGHESNGIGANVTGATIAGGGGFLSGFLTPNSITASFGTIGGGLRNSVGGFAGTVTGGYSNAANGSVSFVGGGSFNIAAAEGAVIPGGYNNIASGSRSFAAGQAARANHDSTFVWSDSSLSLFGSTAPNQFLVRAAGGVGINTNNPAGYTLNVNGSQYISGGLTTAFSELRWPNSTPYIDFTNDATTDYDMRLILLGNDALEVQGGTLYAFTLVPSDARYKENIAPLPDALDTILHLRGVSYDWNRMAREKKRFVGGRQIGFIAQEVEKVLPELVNTNDDGYRAVNYVGVVPVLVEAVKTQQKQIDALKKDNGAVRNDNTTLKQRQAALEADNARKDARIEALEARLAAIERVLAELKADRK